MAVVVAEVSSRAIRGEGGAEAGDSIPGKFMMLPKKGGREGEWEELTGSLGLEKAFNAVM